MAHRWHKVSATGDAGEATGSRTVWEQGIGMSVKIVPGEDQPVTLNVKVWDPTYNKVWADETGNTPIIVEPGADEDPPERYVAAGQGIRIDITGADPADVAAQVAILTFN